MSTMPAAGAEAAPITDGSAFEGMFQRALQPTGEFAEALRRAGYDLKAPQARYPTQVWRDCLEVARLHEHPQLSPEEGYRALGRRFIEGFFATITGRFLRVALKMLSPERILQRLTRYWSMARAGVAFEVQAETPTRWRVDVRDQYPQPDYMAAIIEVGVAQSGVSPRVDVVSRRADGFSVIVSW